MTNAMTKTDAIFLRHFVMVIGGLVVVALLLIALASWIHARQPKEQSPVRQEQLAQRIAPVGAVYAGDTGRAAAAAAQEARLKAAAAQVAYGGTSDGKQIYDQLCHSCHTTGVAGSPKLDDKAAWAPRLAQGMDTLIKHATEGFTGKTGTMPAKGGNPALNDVQIKATVEWMAAQVK